MMIKMMKHQDQFVTGLVKLLKSSRDHWNWLKGFDKIMEKIKKTNDPDKDDNDDQDDSD